MLVEDYTISHFLLRWREFCNVMRGFEFFVPDQGPGSPSRQDENCTSRAAAKQKMTKAKASTVISSSFFVFQKQQRKKSTKEQPEKN